MLLIPLLSAAMAVLAAPPTLEPHHTPIGDDDADHTGLPPQMCGCDASSATQRWTQAAVDGQAGAVSLCQQLSGAKVCLYTNASLHEGTVFAINAQPGITATDVSWQLQPSPFAAPDNRGVLLRSVANPSQCASVAGCCDSGPLRLVACSNCKPSGSQKPPSDCLFSYNASTKQLETELSSLCIDAAPELPLAVKACKTHATQALPFCDDALSPDKRAADLVSRLTLEEKASGVLSMLMTPTEYADGRPLHYNLRQTAGVPRLGVPPLLFNEAMHGIVALCLDGKACPTSYPGQLGQTASFNRSLWHSVATALGTEGRALYNAGLDAANYWAPDVNPFRDPRYGRGQETGGEDAWLNGEVAVDYVLGLQGGPANGSTALRATAACKHILLYDTQTPNPNSNDFNVSRRDMADYYMVPWEACAKVAHSASMMCSYGSFDGKPDCAHGDYLNGVIRQQFGWGGFVVSDCDAVNGIASSHLPGTSGPAAAAMAMNAGVDLDCGPFYGSFLPRAVRQGLVAEATVDTAAKRVLEHQMRLGTFEHAVGSKLSKFDAIPLSVVGSQAHSELAYEAAVQSMTLLKNHGGLLPLSVGLKIAISGPHANSTLDLLGNDYMKDNQQVLSNTPLLAAKRRGLKLTYSKGCASGLSCADDSGFAAAVSDAKAADVAVVFLGLSEAFENEGHDRRDLDLPGKQLELALAVARAQPKTVVVLAHGGIVTIDALLAKNSTVSILSMFYPGQAAGDAVWACLLGARPPAGRLPYTWYTGKFVAERGAMDKQDLRQGQGITYRYYKNKAGVALPYGFGLMFGKPEHLTYDWRTPIESVSTASLAQQGGVRFSLTAHNAAASNVTTDMTLLIFVRFSGDESGDCPIKTLAGFERLKSVAPGNAQSGTFLIPTAQLACTDDRGVVSVRPGAVSIEVGDVMSPLTHPLQITGAELELPPRVPKVKADDVGRL